MFRMIQEGTFSNPCQIRSDPPYLMTTVPLPGDSIAKLSYALNNQFDLMEDSLLHRMGALQLYRWLSFQGQCQVLIGTLVQLRRQT